ncbi:FecR family protein [Pedobacter sp. ok626]|uniref:FecR family protein n=1 Tax=Pedobacter sp. ok626 TaxID=1761882 RepID=UPI00087FA06F|nr:FecR family protein [Pedobacter sp. ok626]SDJ36040.1 FecR family protein [Pedobacter sp. ok626]
MMNQRLPYLLNQYLNKSCSETELAEFYALVNDSANELEFNDLLADAVRNTGPEYQLNSSEKANLLQHVFNHEADAESVMLTPMVRKRNWSRLTAVAALLLMVSTIGLYFFNNKNLSENQQAQNTSRDEQPVITPGGNKAVLTLDNGTVINLEDAKNGQLANEAGTLVTKTQSGQLVYNNKQAQSAGGTAADNAHINTLTTPRGGQYQVNLPDGTKVWLNAASSLKFPSTFSGLTQRKVELSGEAYFEVAKVNSPQKLAFVVVSGKQEVEVLGTHFNINAYADEANTKTTLLEGSVKVSQAGRSHNVILKPGQEAVLTADDFVVQQADLERSIDWKSNKFIFKNESLEGIMRKISRWYDVEVVYAGSVPKQETFSGTLSRFDRVEKVLRRLEMTGVVSFKIKDRRITVLK